MVSIKFAISLLVLLLTIRVGCDAGGIVAHGSAHWDASPATNDWNTAVNWTPDIVPNGPLDTASFGMSSRRNVTLSALTEVNGIVFEVAASPFVITSGPFSALNISGVGITNNSAITQSFLADTGSSSGDHGSIGFSNSATAGSSTTYTANGAVVIGGLPGALSFAGQSNAGSATFFMNGSSVFTAGPPQSGSGGLLSFGGTSSAAQGTFTNGGGLGGGGNGGVTQFGQSATAGNGNFTDNGGAANSSGGRTLFFDSSTAGHATFTNNASNAGGTAGVIDFLDQSTGGSALFTNNGGAVSGAGGGLISFLRNSSAGNAMLTNNGGSATGTSGGVISLFDSATAGNATITNNGGTTNGVLGGLTFFSDHSTAGAATLIANGGTHGGLGGVIEFSAGANGGTSRVEVFGNGNLGLDQSAGPATSSSVTIGSIEGDGNVFLNGRTLAVGSNDRTTTFSGSIQNGMGITSSLTKIGAGTLTLSGANSYTGNTTVNAGALLVDGSITSDVTVNGGTLGGSGEVETVTVNTGGALSPGDSPGVLTVHGSVTLKLGATYLVDLNGTALGTQYDQTDVNGLVLIKRAMLRLDLGFTPSVGTEFVIINNDGTDPVMGFFRGFRQGKKFSLNGQKFKISYFGGDGNDVVLIARTGPKEEALAFRAVPEPQTWALLAGGALGFIVFRRRRNRRTSRSLRP